MPHETQKRRVCFVTGTRAEFGLMRSTLSALAGHSKLQLQIIATGMHLSREHGRTLSGLRDNGWKIDAVVPWRVSSNRAIPTGLAMARLAGEFERINTDIVVVVGDRVEAFAAAAAAHLSGKMVAHIHGGDRALGQVDDALRHAITKLAHLHFPATAASAKRIAQLGEDAWRIQRPGSPGIDGIATQAAHWREILSAMPSLSRRRYALLVLHPTGTADAEEFQRAALVLRSLQNSRIKQSVIVYPNNDPGSLGIIRCWQTRAQADRQIVCRDLARPVFLALLRDAAVLIGNSSSGIIEAASFGTPVIDIGQRQQGREHGGNVKHLPFDAGSIGRALNQIWNDGRPMRHERKNIYGGAGAGRRIANVLARTVIDERLLRKLITY